MKNHVQYSSEKLYASSRSRLSPSATRPARDVIMHRQKALSVFEMKYTIFVPCTIALAFKSWLKIPISFY